jgi:hypothetical protein
MRADVEIAALLQMTRQSAWERWHDLDETAVSDGSGVAG